MTTETLVNINDKMLEIQNLKTYFHTEEGVVKAVDDVSLVMNPGEILGLVGESGCGKSTIALSILNMIQKPGEIVEGKINFQGRNILELNEEELRDIRGGKISIIWQDPLSSLNPVFTIGYQLAEVIELHQGITNKEELKEKIIKMLEKVGVSDPERRIKQYPHEFSGGMRQRIMIAMALSCNPRLLIADEPTTSLDVTIQAQILDLLLELREEFKSSILIITHNLGIVAELADKVAVMYAGNIVEFGDIVPVFKNPLHPYTKSLINSIPRIDLEQQKLESIPGFVPNLITPPPGCKFNPRCSKTMEICSRELPILRELSTGHWVRCHLYNEQGEN